MKHWSDIKERAAGYWRLMLMLKIYQIFGRRIVRIATYPIVFCVFIFSKELRNSSLQYLNRIYKIKAQKGDHNFKKPDQFIVFKHIFSFADSLIDRVASWSGEINLDKINIKTKKTYSELLQLLEENKGAFFICSHVGNIELFRALGNLKTKNLLTKKLAINALMQIEHCSQFKSLLKKLNAEVETNLFSAIDIGVETVIELKDKLQNGEIVVTAGDRTAAKNKDKAVVVNFLGEKAYFPIGSFTLASIMEVPVYFVFCMKEENAEKSGYNFYIYKTKTSLQGNRKTRKAQIDKMVQEYASYLEKFCLKYPYQWYNFFDFWKISPKEFNI